MTSWLKVSGACLAVAVSVAVAAAGPKAAKGTVSYEKVVRPALENAICFRSSEYQGKTYYGRDPKGCPAPASFTEVQRELAETARKTVNDFLYRDNQIFMEALKAVPESPETKEKLLKTYRGLLFSDPVLLRILMPKVEQVLAKAGLNCPDCPGPHVAPAPDRVTVQQLLPYAAAFLWPTRLMSGNRYEFYVCVGMNGIPRIAHPDPLLTDAAFACVFKDGDAMGMGEATVAKLMQEKEYMALKDDGAKLAYLQEWEAKRLIADPAFTAFIRKQAAVKLPLYGLACADCDAAPEKAAGAASDPQPAKELTAQEILARTARVYAACASYQDSGTVETTFHTGHGTFKKGLSFSTAFVRPDQFRFEYAEEGSSTGTREYIVWRHGGEVKSWWSIRPGVKKEKSLSMALAAATGVSAGSAHAVPSLLMPKEVEGRRLSDLTDAVRKADEPVEGHACFVVEGKIPPSPPKVAEKLKLPRPYPNLSRTVWIDEATFVVRKVEMTLPISRGDAVEVTTYEPALDAAVPESALVFNPPATP